MVYNRSILLPYLRDLCAVEMAYTRIKRGVAQSQSRIEDLKYAINKKVTPPTKRHVDVGLSFSDVFGLLFLSSLVIANVAFSSWLYKYLPILGIGGYIVSAIFTLCFVSSYKGELNDKRRRAQNEDSDYEKRLRQYRDAVNRKPLHQQALKDELQRLALLKQRRTTVEKIRTELYAINRIPDPYRNVESAYYLWNYFSTSGENDLDRVIQTMLLHDIRSKLQTVIRQQEDILLNQRIQMALQEQSNRQAAITQRNQLQHYARMERDHELQIAYEKMIIGNQVVTNYFLAADYFRKR